MRLHIGILVLVTVISQIPRESRSDTSIQDTRMASDQEMVRGSETEKYKEELEAEPEMTKRVRNRGTKRRRRLRQRSRTTEQPSEVDIPVEINTAASFADGSENEEVVVPRRRPGKRRRRPLRRYHDSDQPAGRPRRRKGGRKRIRTQIINMDDIETTTFISLEYESPVTSSVMSEDVSKTELQGKQNIGTTEEYHQLDDSLSSSTDSVYQLQINNSIKDSLQITDNHVNENKEFHNELITPQNKDENMQSLSNSGNEFGNKIFDRKSLFSSSRKLPETSATLRRRLSPRTKNAFKNSTFGNHVRIIKPLANLASEWENEHKIKNEIITQQIMPNGYTVKPEIIEPYQLINKIKSQNSEEQNFEEPNYPKLDLFIRKTKTALSKETTTPTVNLYTTTPFEMETTVPEQNVNEENANITSTNLKNSSPQLPKFEDEVLELLKTETGNKRLQRILEIRNMTLTQLLDHRERGSSKFHLSDIFTAKTQSTSEKINKTKEITNDQKTETTIGKFSRENDISSLPDVINENILSSINDPTEYFQKNNRSQRKEYLDSIQSRESRIFDSLPEFTSTKASIPEVRPYPTWRIIPNPKLKPVSIRGDYEEIKISNVITTHKSYPENEIDNIYLLEERDNFINHREKVIASTETRETFFFRKIPVSVKSAIVISGAILVLAIFGFLSVLVSCRLRQKKARLRAKQDILCEHLQNDDFMASQQSLSPVLRKHNRGPPVFSHAVHSNTASNRHYYLWRTLRKTFQYD